jgi:hypothetical protein
MSAINVTQMSKPVRGGVGYMATCSSCNRRNRLSQHQAKYYVSPDAKGMVWVMICKCGVSCAFDVSAQQCVESDGGNGAAQLKAVCEDCGLPYESFLLDITLPNEQWLAIHPSGKNGLLCAQCIVARASKLSNIIAVRAVLDLG